MQKNIIHIVETGKKLAEWLDYWDTVNNLETIYELIINTLLIYSYQYPIPFHPSKFPPLYFILWRY